MRSYSLGKLCPLICFPNGHLAGCFFLLFFLFLFLTSSLSTRSDFHPDHATQFLYLNCWPRLLHVSSSTLVTRAPPNITALFLCAFSNVSLTLASSSFHPPPLPAGVSLLLFPTTLAFACSTYISRCLSRFGQSLPHMHIYIHKMAHLSVHSRLEKQVKHNLPYLFSPHQLRPLRLVYSVRYM